MVTGHRWQQIVPASELRICGDRDSKGVEARRLQNSSCGVALVDLTEEGSEDIERSGIAEKRRERVANPCRELSRHGRKQPGESRVNCRRAEQWGPRRGRPRAFERLLALARDDEIVLHGKNIGNPVGTNVRKVLIGFVIHYTFQRYVPILYYDVNGRHGLNGITRERGLSINGAVHRPAELVIERRGGKNLDIVHHRGDSLDALHRSPGIRLQNRPGHLTVKSHRVAVYSISKIVEHGIPRQQDELVPHLFRKFFPLRRFAALFLLIRRLVAL